MEFWKQAMAQGSEANIFICLFYFSTYQWDDKTVLQKNEGIIRLESKKR